MTVLLVVLTARHTVQAEDDVLNFARQWAGREEKEQTTPALEPVQVPREAVKRKSAPAKPARAPATAVSPAKPRVQKEVLVSSAITELPVPALPAPVVQVADAALLGQWLNTFRQAFSPTPQETELKVLHAAQRQKIAAQNHEIAELKEQLKEQEDNKHQLQAALHDLQQPPVPSAGEGLEDFAAGVAAGRELQTMLETRKKWGVTMDPGLFIAGLTDALRNENRLDEESIELALAGLDQRLAAAREQFFHKREDRDLQWLKEFRSRKAVQVTSEGYSYQILHQGERPLRDENVLTVALTRKFVDGTVLEDSDISGKYIRAPLSDFPSLIQPLLHTIGNHGEGEMAVTVNRHGEPHPDSKLTEIWRIRVMDTAKFPQSE
ncbi:TPA: FKBP-type peptidyl-prolyl cis-trans isomerase N-terminal domain-containing protein [Klebsiella oxytoca]